MDPTVPEGYNDFTPKDLKFLQTCLNMVTDMLGKQPLTQAQEAGIAPVVEEDGSVCEAQVDWTINGSKLMLCLGRNETIPMTRFAEKGIGWQRMSVPRAKAAIQHADHVDPEIRNLMCRFIDRLEEWGYVASVAHDNGYPIPTINFTKVDCIVGVVTLIEATARPANQSIN